MASLLSLAASQPARTLGPDEALLVEGATGGDLYVLESGELAVERNGVAITTISQPGSLVGEMSILLGSANSATVRAVGYANVRVIRDARTRLLQDPELTFRVASLVAGRLNATTALLVEMTKEHPGKTEQGLLGRILAALHLSADDSVVERNDLFDPGSGLFTVLPPGR